MRHRYSFGPTPVLAPRLPRRLAAAVPGVAGRPVPAILWGHRREDWTAARRSSTDPPHVLAAPAPAVLPLDDVADLVPEMATDNEPTRPRRRPPHMRIEPADESAMTAAEVKSRAVDFAAWRARHRNLHRHHEEARPCPSNPAQGDPKC